VGKIIFSVDVEDWFVHIFAKTGIDDFDEKDFPIRINIGLRKILKLLKLKNISATFFILGIIAEKCPDIIQEIESYNHEIACHGYNHKMLTLMTPDEFRTDLDKSLKILTKYSKNNIIGYRAPVFSITENTLWALDILKNFGFIYDSSIFLNTYHPEYGFNIKKYNSIINNYSIREFPITCTKFLNINIPLAGGGYFRLYPYNFFRLLINKGLNNKQDIIFHIHPWELDEQQPRINASTFYFWRHYHNLNSTASKLEKFLNDFEFESFSDRLKIKRCETT
jgi:polysaccharide deacetylase family protein (PEP-CTERM system associated)